MSNTPAITEVAHTPGPWRVFDRADFAWPGIEADPGLSVVIYGYGDEETGVRGHTTAEGRANARLIAAAPTMLAALQAADQFIRNGIELGFIRMPDAGTPDPALKTPGIVRAAIARATTA